ncbi:C4-dicarboxylate ABC transporter permease [Salipiger sp. CCB-MM3]|uniref:TRAP transporter small permease n=1 Tax=Roseobacteraceae TaxID=2854170 RepID=UPI00080AC26A|nr:MULTISPECIES: TRAP transporter small permease [Roseobacteraceae]ANT62409.1 C4-dicarboxylate ABC transporter permease [Salipiger sp. CCB-MM3]MCA0996922.1 TRAP transporter small permease [Alloyangia pacifica]
MAHAQPAGAGAIYRLLNLLSRLCVLVAGSGLVLLIAIFGWLVWGRYVMNDTPTWVEQLALILVVWITFLGAAAGVWSRTHLSVDFIRDAFPGPIAMAMKWLALLGVLIFAICLGWQGYILAENTWARTVPMLGISEGMRAVPMAICGALSALFTLYQMAELAKGRGY